MQKQVMQLAWSMYRNYLGSTGSVDRKIFAQALRAAWALVKGEVSGSVRVTQAYGGFDYMVAPETNNLFINDSFVSILGLAEQANQKAQLLADTLGLEVRLYTAKVKKSRRGRKTA